jgi:hypothetical protein
VIPEPQIITAWCEAIRSLYALARGERLGELTGRRSRLLDDRGLHPYSLEVGRVMALQELYPALDMLEFRHLLIKKAAQEDAEEQFKMTTALDVGERCGWIPKERIMILRQSLDH